MFFAFNINHQRLEILENVTTKWKDIIHQLDLWSFPSSDVVRIKGSDIELSRTPMFPSCKSFEISKYWPFESPNNNFAIKFNPMSDLMIWLEIEDRRKALAKRKLRSSSLAYEGSPISLKELKPAKYNICKRYICFVCLGRDISE